ncbi:3-phosphoshikimate 1-carboxyvinyltransferase [Ascidiimonas aurantiaca]|uniref:3-phosphoshikimate 1-carboxyvinyltransferase n=1 Tax=Ascidiimonas aurantiaca TaxID=1685432 RepID=UPI0030EF5775
MKLLLQNTTKNVEARIRITGSKSESNRLLILKALFPSITINNLSNSDDTQVMQKALASQEHEIDIHHAGTAMRFLTSYFAIQENRSVILTGSHRMKERPVKILVEALNSLGADIRYLEKQGYPPLHIRGKKLSGGKVRLKANVSSQYISSLLLIGARLQNGLEIELEDKVTSLPYIQMTLTLLKKLGVSCSFKGHTVKVSPFHEIPLAEFTVESDWSSASYYYSLAAIAPKANIRLSSYHKNSLQGDHILQDIYRFFGVDTRFSDGVMWLTHLGAAKNTVLKQDLTQAPDIAQTIAVTCFATGKACHLTGLHTLKIKETDRLEALKTELGKLGAKIQVTDSELILSPSGSIKKGVAINTYDDHRMAMAFAPLAMKEPILINNAEVVSKSYPDFWNDLKLAGIDHIKQTL